MSREGGAAGGGRRGGADSGSSNGAAPPFPPQFYPVMGYQGAPHAWFPPHPSSGVPAQWSPSWRPPMGYPTSTPPWSSQQSPATTVAATTSDEYTVDTLRRVFKDDDGRVEIQRVKVQRRQPEGSAGGAVTVTDPEDMSVVPAGSLALSERRPPPRKHRRKHDIHLAAPLGPAGPYPWYPYMPYMPYPYPYPYYLAGCMWPPPDAPSDSIPAWSGHEDSEAASSRQDSAIHSQRLESRASRDSLPSTLQHRASSPAAASHITDIHSIAPSDSVSVRGRKRETSLERALRGPTPPPRTKSRASSSLSCTKSDKAGRTQQRAWMAEMQRALRARGDAAVTPGDRGPLPTDHTDVVYKKIPPIRKRRKMRLDNMSDKSSMTDLKDADDASERLSVVTDATFDDSRLSSELNYAFRKLERSVDAFKTEIAADHSPLHSAAPSPSVEICHSSGDATPTEARVTPLPLSDIRGLAEKAKEEETQRHERYGRARATSESIASLPSLETARVGSAPDVSLHSRATFAPSPQLTAPAASSPTLRSPSPRPAAPPPPPPPTRSVTDITSSPETQPTETRVVTSKTEAVSEVRVKPSASAEPPDPHVLQSPETPPSPACQPSPLPPPLEQGHPPAVATATTTTTTTTTTTKENEGGIAPVPAGRHVVPAEGTTEGPSANTSGASTVVVSPAAPPAEGVGEASGRLSQASNATTFFSLHTADSHALDTDSTDIPLAATDSATADENEDSAGSGGPEDDDQVVWVLQRPEEAPTLGQDEPRNAWRAEVSLWRARLVVSLCRGRGLDRQDWATLHLMVHHPLTMDLKLSLLHAPRLCAANSNIGPAMLRVALLQLVQHGETLLQPESARQAGWRSIRLDGGHAWTSVKGAAEILHSLGYQERRSGAELRYRRRCGAEASVVARLTLDMLVLGEELRLFLTGTHQYPNNVSSLFFPESPPTVGVPDLPQRPPSSEGSFVSAQSEAAPVPRPQSEASSVTDDDTVTLQTAVTETSSRSKLTRDKSSSEEEITLKEDDIAQNTEIKAEATQQKGAEIDTKTLPGGQQQQQQLPTPDAASISSDVTSLPDLQSVTSSTVTPESQRPSGSEASSGRDTLTPAATPTLEAEVDSAPITDGAKPAATTDAANDNPEEHVYEEIDVIRGQVQSIRASSVPAESAPPPLPPKKKISAGGEDDSGQSFTYPKVEWSSASTPASLRGGSTGARRKKRRAPMPPEFLPPNWREDQETVVKAEAEAAPKTQEDQGPDAATRKAEYRRSLNPFYEEIDQLEENGKEEEDQKDSAHDDTQDDDAGNPFFEGKRASGYVGKNPFYDDVEMIKKSEEYKELAAKQPSAAPPTDESPAAPTVTEQPDDVPVVRPKRRAPRPPPTPEAQEPRPAAPPEDPASPQREDKPVPASVSQGAEASDSTDQAAKQTSESVHQNIIESPSSASQDTLKNASETKTEAELTEKPESSVGIDAIKVPGEERLQDRPPEPPRLTPKLNRAIRASPSHPRKPPPPPPTLPKANTPSVLPKDSPPPIPPPKAPLSLLDEIPYMDANEVKEAKEQLQSDTQSDALVHGVTSSPASTLKFQHAHFPSLSPPPLPPCSPPDSPPETPHTSPPSTPHTSPPSTPHASPPETPHVSPPVTPHASPPVTPRVSPKQSPLPPSRQKPQESSKTTAKDNVVSKTEEAPPIPPKIVPLEIVNGDTTPTAPAQTDAPPVPPKNIHEPPPPPPPPPSLKTATAIHAPVKGTNSVQSSASEERYEIPDTSRAPPPRPPVSAPSKSPQQQQSNGKTPTKPVEYDRYEVPEAPKQPVTASKESVKAANVVAEAEERYEIPEVVKEQPVKRGVNGAPCTVSPRRGEMAAVFGPPKPPRRHRNTHSPPPRPPKSTSMDGMSEAAPTASTSSFTSSSASLQTKRAPKRRSWPFLLCECLYVNSSRSHEDADKRKT